MKRYIVGVEGFLSERLLACDMQSAAQAYVDNLDRGTYRVRVTRDDDYPTYELLVSTRHELKSYRVRMTSDTLEEISVVNARSSADAAEIMVQRLKPHLRPGTYTVYADLDSVDGTQLKLKVKL